MAMIHQEVCAVFLGRNGVRVGFRDLLENLHRFDIEFIAAGGARLGADLTADDEGRFLGEVDQGIKGFFGQRAFYGDALHDAGAIAQDGEGDLAGLAQIVEPAGDFDRLTNMCRGAGDSDSFRHLWFGALRDVRRRAGFR